MQSMTGFGQAHWEDPKVTVDVEVRSVNHRFFKLVTRLPDGLSAFESQLEELVRKRLSRGTIELDVKVKERVRSTAVTFNEALLKTYAKKLKSLSTTLKVKNGVDFALLLGLPGVLEVDQDQSEHVKALWPKILRVADEAVDAIAEMRAREGKRLTSTLEELLKSIQGYVERIRLRAPVVPADYKARLSARLELLLAGKTPNATPADISRELAIFADRCDIAEEIQRLSSHLVEFRRTLKTAGDIGKRLDFLTQEMVREANTMGSKANDAEISQSVIAIKAEVERIKEQVQNVE
ncbi:MAG: YicC family protein [Planctomycetes bacterium]|nr:YicC family protein [Planctomycetota bacterium]